MTERRETDRTCTARLEADARELRARLEALEKLLDEKEMRFAQGLSALKEQIQLALTASEKAIEKAEANAERWRVNANEWRGAMDDRENKFASRDLVDREFANVRTDLMSLHKSRDESSGQRSVTSSAWGYVIAAVSLLLTGVALVFRK